MLNPTDYAAYSRATGRPYPQNEEERAEMYGEVRNFRNNQLRNEDENNIGQNLAIGGLGLGALALTTAAGRKSMAQRQAQRRSTGGGGRRGGIGFQDNPPATPKDPSGGGGSSGLLADLPSVTRRGAYDRAAAATPDPGVGKDVQYRNPGSGGTDLSMLIADETTGEIYRRGGGQSIRSQQARDAIKDVNNRVDQLLADVSVGDAGQMLAGPEVAAEARQMSGTESSRQSAAVRRLEKKEESLAKNILSELAAETPAQTSKLSPKEQAFYNSLETDESRSRYLTEVKNKFETPTLTENYEAVGEPAARLQNIDALNTAEDQSDGRFLRALQRNEDIDMAMVNEDVIDAAGTQTAQDALFRENQLVQDARDYLIRQEIDLKYDYTPEESRQAAAVGQALERIQNNPTRVAAEGIIDELRTEARAVADRAKFAKEQRQGKTGELPGYREADNIRQRTELKTLPEIGAPRETIESLLTGEETQIETNLQGRQLRGGRVDEAGDVRFSGAGSERTDASTGARLGKQGEKYKPKAQLEAMFNRYSDDELEQIVANKSGIAYGDMMQQDLDELQTAQRVLKTRAQTSIDQGIDLSYPQYRALNRGRKGLEASEASRKRFENQPPVPASQPVQDVARSMETLRQGMSVEPSEAAPVIPDIRNIGFEGDQVIAAVGPDDVYTGAARDAAGSLKDVVVGESAPLVQGGVVSNPEVAAEIEDQSQAFLQRAISGGLTQKANPGVEVYETPRMVGPAELSGPGSVPLSRTAAPDPQRGPEPSQRLGYARYYVGPEGTGSKPAGVVTGVSPTVNIDYASMPQSDVYRPTDVGRVVYRGPVQTSAERLSQSTGGLARPTSILPDRGDTRLTSSLPVPQYDPRYKTLNRSQYNPPAPGYTDIADRPASTGVAPIGPLTQSPGLPKIGRVDRGPALENQATGPVITQYGQNIRYPNMRGQERFTTEQLMNDPSLRGGPVKMPNRFRDQFVVERPRGY